MATKRDYYEVLGVSKTATLDEIKKAYRKLAMANHPDRNPGDKAAEDRFKEATEAYEILSDDKKRKAYDQFGFQGVEGAGGAGNYENTYRDFSDLFSGMGFGGGFSDLFSSFFGGGGANGTRSANTQSAYYGDTPLQGDSLRYDIAIDLATAINGAKVEVSFSHYVKCDNCNGTGAEKGSSRKTCPDCHGQGFVVRSNGIFQMRSTCPTCGGQGTVLEHPCSVCGGSGVVKKKEKILVDVPKGIDSGNRILVRGMGNAAPNGGNPGDLYVYVTVKEDKHFYRRGNDLYCRLPISITQATLGAKVELTCVTGEVISIEIPEGSYTGKLLRVKGKGANEKGGKLISSKGDLFVSLYVQTPSSLSKRGKEIMKMLDDEIKSEKRPNLMDYEGNL